MTDVPIQRLFHGRYDLRFDNDGAIIVYINDKYIGRLGNSLIQLRGKKIKQFKDLVIIE